MYYPWCDTEVLFTWHALCARTRVVWQAVRRTHFSMENEHISADDVLRRFYRRKKYNPNLQLKEICREFNVSYAYVRKRKVAFDKRRKPRNKGGV